MGLAVTAKEMVKFLKTHGFWIERTNRHHILTNGFKTFPVSKHDKRS